MILKSFISGSHCCLFFKSSNQILSYRNYAKSIELKKEKCAQFWKKFTLGEQGRIPCVFKQEKPEGSGFSKVWMLSLLDSNVHSSLPFSNSSNILNVLSASSLYSFQPKIKLSQTDASKKRKGLNEIYLFSCWCFTFFQIRICIRWPFPPIHF